MAHTCYHSGTVDVLRVQIGIFGTVELVLGGIALDEEATAIDLLLGLTRVTTRSSTRRS